MRTEPWPTSNWPENVPHDISGYDKPLFSILDESAKDYPDHTYTIFSGATRTYAQVKDTADRVANFLVSKGIKKGDRVAIFLPNLPHYPAIYFGIIKAGAVCVTCNPQYTAGELNYQLNDAGAKAVFIMDHADFYPMAVEAVKGTKIEIVVICGVKSYLPGVTAFLGGLLGKIPKAKSHESDHYFFDKIVAAAKPEPPVVDIDPSKDLALIIYTGGTTGLPKGAALTHANFQSNLTAMLEWMRAVQVPGGKVEPMRTGGFHCFLGVLPWYHSFGMTLVMLMSCATANKLVCIPDPRAGDPPFTEVLKAVEKYKATFVAAVPTIYVAFTNHALLNNFDLSSMILCGSGGAPMPVEVAKKFEEKTGSVIFEGYGLSETSPVACMNPTDTETRKFGSIGFPIPGTDVKVLDKDTGLKEQPQGEDGEIAISGPQVMTGYWQKPDENKKVFREIDGQRFFLTGDIGNIDENGYVTITDRKKDLILVGGFNCYPREVEEVLYSNPKVENAAVVGIPDAKSGESVKAFIQLKANSEATAKEMLDFCKERLAGYKRPRSIEFRDELPMSGLGKVLRRVLRDEEMDK